MPTNLIRYRWPSDDEQLAGQWSDSHFDEDGSWWNSLQKLGGTVALAAALAIGATTTLAATSVFNQSQDDPAGNLVFVSTVQEEYWQNPVPPVNWPQPIVLTDDDVHPTFARIFTPDDGDWRQLVSPVPATNYVQLPFIELDNLPQEAAVNPIVDDAANIWAPQIQPWEPNWTLLFFLDDGSTVPIFQYDEDFWQNPVPPYNWPQPAQPFQASDDDNLVIQFAAEDVFWPQYVAPVADSLVWPQQFKFEQNEPGNLVAFANEDYWQNPVSPVPDSIWLLRQDAFEQTDATGALFLNLYDDFVPTLVTPVPDSLRLLQQWPFDEFESSGGLRTTVDEDFWINPVAPVVWNGQPLPIIDEVIETFVQNFAQDEDFWWQPVIPPVQAQNIYWQPFNLLGQQEDDTPVLSPFVPPPIVPCLPPLGPDGDVTLNYFGGNKNPTQVLLCRVCKSGKPLLVRGDYAIWCQDCCSFVSKQDTVMMTVSAPGQFRGTF